MFAARASFLRFVCVVLSLGISMLIFDALPARKVFWQTGALFSQLNVYS